MKSGRQRRTQLKQPRSGKPVAIALAAEKARLKTAAKTRAARLKGQVLVNVANLRPTNSYGRPDFVAREFYVDRPFKCNDCGSAQVWTATQQSGGTSLRKATSGPSPSGASPAGVANAGDLARGAV